MRYALTLAALTASLAHAAGLTLTTAEVDAQATQDRACIRSSNAQIDAQRAIAADVGVYDKRVMYVAGVNKRACQMHIQRLLACRPTGCPKDREQLNMLEVVLPWESSGLDDH